MINKLYMSCYSPWNSISEPSNNNNLMEIDPVKNINWIFPIQVNINGQSNQNQSLNSNHNYQTIGRDFFEKYSTASSSSITYLENYYHPQSFNSIHVHIGTNNLYEVIGYDNLRNKLAELKINAIKYHSTTFTCQPIGTDAIIITTAGKATINRINYSIISTFIIKNFDYGSKIMNHMLDIFA